MNGFVTGDVEMSKYQQRAEALGWRACSRYEHEQQSNMKTRGQGTHFINKARDASFACELFGDDAWQCLCETAMENSNTHSNNAAS
jgi:hypothetical protein